MRLVHLTPSRAFALILLAGGTLSMCVAVAIAETNPEHDGQQLLDAAGVRGGIVVHLGCGNGRLTGALQGNNSFVVHGLDSDANAIAQARQYLQSLGRYGAVSVQHGDPFGPLPYGDNVVNLVVAEELTASCLSEVMRVLVPRGVVLTRSVDVLGSGGGDPPCDSCTIRLGDQTWLKITKPLPREIDEWTHYLHGSDNNALSRDSVVGPPQSVQWLTGPKWGRNHEKQPGLSALVSASGRMFSIVDEGPIHSISLPPQWTLVARDAFNGTLLWKRPLGTWEWPLLWHFSVSPAALPRRLIAVEDRVYLTPGYGEPVCALDAADGRAIKEYAGTENTCEIVYANGILACTVNKSANTPPERKWDDRYADIRIADPTEIVAVDTASGTIRWRHDVQQTFWLQTLANAQGQITFLAGNDVVCLDARTGVQRWCHTLPDRPAMEEKLYNVPCIGRATLVVHPKAVLIARGGKELTVLSPDTGERLWSCPCGAGFRLPVDLFVADDLVWVGEGLAWQNAPDLQVARHVLTGEIARRISTEEAFRPAHHHRCYRNKATERYFLIGRKGVEFIDHQQDAVKRHSWIRGSCQYGVLPCNGLLYVPSDACSCYIRSKLNGFYALTARPSLEQEQTRRASMETRFERGPGFERAFTQEAADGSLSGDWPTYRHDAARSGWASTEVSLRVKPAWHTQLPAPISPPVLADGIVYVAAKDAHTIYALDASSGARRWSYTADARIDSPPTVWQGRVLFGANDGCVYCVGARDGRLCWRWRAAPAHRLIGVHDQLESTWPVHGSVLVRDGVAYVTAGRSSYVDHGIWLYRLNPKNGTLLSETRLYSRDPRSGRQLEETGKNYLPGYLSDILSSRGERVFMRHAAFDLQGNVTSDRETHLYNPGGFLDDTGFNRIYTVLGSRTGAGWGPWTQFDGIAAGRLLVFGDTDVYGFGRNRFRQPQGNVRLAYPLPNVHNHLFRKDAKGKQRWSVRLPFEVRAMTCVGDRLFVAGPKGDTYQSKAAYSGEQGVALWAIQCEDGNAAAKWELQSLPVFDGMIAAQGSLVISMQNGTVCCWQ